MIPPCSCGSNRTYVCAQAKGPVRHHFDGEGQFVETFYDKLYFDPSHIVRCEDCGRIRQDLRLAEERLVVVEATRRAGASAPGGAAGRAERDAG